MAQIKTPYGLVYNTDGSLCTTYRDDDIPFPGVRSFAVEEATENLVQNPQFLNDRANYGAYNWGGGGYIEVVNNIMNMHNESGTADLALLQNFTIDNTKEHTISCRVRSANGQDCPIDVYFGAGYYRIGTAPANGAWVTLERTYVPSELAASSTMFFKIPSGKYLQIDWLQLEQKPFATSFVDGSRPNGNISLPFTEKDDFVITFWFKPDWEWGSIPTPISHEKTYNLVTWGEPGANGFLSRIVSTSEINIQSYKPTVNITYDAAHFNGFVNFVIKKIDKTITVYANGEQIMENTNSSLVEPTENVLWFGSRRNEIQYGRANGLFSNIFIGKYRKPNGEIIWTDEYIREVYEAQIPFPEQNKLSIY